VAENIRVSSPSFCHMLAIGFAAETQSGDPHDDSSWTNSGSEWTCCLPEVKYTFDKATGDCTFTPSVFIDTPISLNSKLGFTQLVKGDCNADDEVLASLWSQVSGAAKPFAKKLMTGVMDRALNGTSSSQDRAVQLFARVLSASRRLTPPQDIHGDGSDRPAGNPRDFPALVLRPEAQAILDEAIDMLSNDMGSNIDSFGRVMSCKQLGDVYIEIKSAMCCNFVSAFFWYVGSFWWIGISLMCCGCPGGIAGHLSFGKSSGGANSLDDLPVNETELGSVEPFQGVSAESQDTGDDGACLGQGRQRCLVSTAARAW